MERLIAGGIGIASGFISALFFALGFKSRQDEQDKKYDRLEKAVVYRDTCEQCRNNISNQFTDLKTDINQANADIKSMLKLIYDTMPKRAGDDR